jgi:hypothetical protein
MTQSASAMIDLRSRIDFLLPAGLSLAVVRARFVLFSTEPGIEVNRPIHRSLRHSPIWLTR